MQKEEINILVIDDEEMIVKQLSLYLDKCGYRVSGESDPTRAVQRIRSTVFDMVITDLKMPKISGMDIVKLVKENYPDTLILIITGYATADSAIEAIQYGVYDYIRKPFVFSELKGIVDRAAEKIFLKRENDALNERIRRMLTYVTTLFDISSILYQVTDFDVVINMIMDTVTEGLNIDKVGIFLNGNGTKTFKHYQSRGLSKQLLEKWELDPQTSLNDIQLHSDSPTVIENIGSGLTINGQTVELAQELKNCVVLPIIYYDRLLAYLVACDIDDEHLSFKDVLKLLNILATQAAPLFLTRDVSTREDQYNIRDLDKITRHIIEEYVLAAKKESRNVYFIQMRVIPGRDISIKIDFEQMQRDFEEIIKSEIYPSSEIVWQSFDSVLIVLNDGTPVEAELACANIRSRLEELYLSDNSNPPFSVRYALMSYPKDGENADEIILGMKKKYYSSAIDHRLNDTVADLNANHQ